MDDRKFVMLTPKAVRLEHLMAEGLSFEFSGPRCSRSKPNFLNTDQSDGGTYRGMGANRQVDRDILCGILRWLDRGIQRRTSSSSCSRIIRADNPAQSIIPARPGEGQLSHSQHKHLPFAFIHRIGVTISAADSARKLVRFSGVL